MAALQPSSPALPDRDRWIDATYRVRASAAQIDNRAQAIALEQSIELPLAAVTDARVLRDLLHKAKAAAR